MKSIRNLLFGTAMLATLGFGVVSATAQPRDAKQEFICPPLRIYEDCVSCCENQGQFNQSWDPVSGNCICLG